MVQCLHFLLAPYLTFLLSSTVHSRSTSESIGDRKGLVNNGKMVKIEKQKTKEQFGAVLTTPMGLEPTIFATLLITGKQRLTIRPRRRP